MGVMRNAYMISGKSLKGRDYLGDLDAEGRMKS
jgi:hypothetical protein